MDTAPPDRRETPEDLLDAILGHPGWSEEQRGAWLDRLVARSSQEELLRAVGARLGDLGRADGEVLVRLVDALESPELFRALAEAVRAQPGLPADRAWDALSLLDEAGLLDDDPELAARWADLSEALGDEEGSLVELAAQLEEDPDGPWVALQALGSVEPEVRAEIVAGLARAPRGPGQVEFLRLAAHAHDPLLREAALSALEASGEDETIAAAWGRIAREHADPGVVARARRRPGGRGEVALAAPDPPGPRLVRSLVEALDGVGRGHVVLMAEDRGRLASAAFLCDVLAGIVEVIGLAGGDRGAHDAFLAEFAARPDRDVVEGAHALALGLLAGGLLLCGPGAPPALRFWLERTAGPRLTPRPLPTPFADEDPTRLPRSELPERAREVLVACPSWVDDSGLTRELADEIALRHPDGPPDPARDAGAYRYLFEHRLRDRLELYRRMLFGMASFWHAAGATDLGRSALALGWQLSDPQHAVAGYPFLQELTTRSLVAARRGWGSGDGGWKTPSPIPHPPSPTQSGS